ncbi:T9SS type A sorting domain-containing protein, partial [Chryseobacterium sp.]|uniref:T9SS type A sorting domain-containing protein n=1 Tax=Chryseobacterium sp. TaxID=1871047 RepID=UPI0025C1974B
IKNTPRVIEEKEIVKAESNHILSLRVKEDELLAIYIFDENKNLIKTVSQEEYSKEGGINLNNMENNSYTFEVATQYYNLQFNKLISTPDNQNTNPDIYTQNRQVIIKSGSDIKSVSIYSISGNLIQNQEVKQTQFESRSLDSGVYMVQVILANGKIIGKKVKL